MFQKKRYRIAIFSLVVSLFLVSVNASVFAAELNLTKSTLNEISAVYNSLPDNMKRNKAILNENIMIYDEDGRIVNEIHSDGRVYSVQWDNDRIAQVIDTAGYKTIYDYSEKGQVTEQIYYNNQLQTSYLREKDHYQINTEKALSADSNLKHQLAEQYAQGLIGRTDINNLETSSSITPLSTVDYYVNGKLMNNLLDSGDFLFSSSQAMTQAQIQTFLNDKNSVLKNSIKVYAINSSNNAYDTGRTVTPAKVIRDAAVNAGINPRVILVSLQKESSLVTSTDTNVNRRAFHYAMGYGATDSGDITTYTGFDKQVELASAWMYDKWLNDSEIFVYKTVNGGVSRTSGGVTYAGQIQVYSYPAWVLYTYTPHVIDYALLPTLSGGNYLFLRIFEGWWSSWY